MKSKLSAREYAVKVCSLSQQTKKTLAEKLKKKYPYDDVDAIITAMEDLGYIDEKSYAQAFIRDSYKIKKHGKKRIAAELSLKGVKSKLIEEALTSAEVDETQIIKDVISKKENLEKEKLTAFLLRRGFSYDDIRRCMNE